MSENPSDAVEQLINALERLITLTPHRANADSAQDLHCTVRAIAKTALSRFPGYSERTGPVPSDDDYHDARYEFGGVAAPHRLTKETLGG